MRAVCEEAHKAGKNAHFAVLDGDPFADITAVLSNVMTIKNGKVMYGKQ